MYKGNKEMKAVRLYLGREREHTVFEAELAGAEISAIMIRRALGRQAELSSMIGIDNQVVIKTTRQERGISGQYIIITLHDQMETLTQLKPDMKNVIQWVPGNVGIAGNERADEEAKKVAGGLSSPEEKIPILLRGQLTINKSAVLQHQEKHLKSKAQRLFAKWPRYRLANDLDPTSPSAAFSKMCQNLPRKNTSILVQLCTGHVALNKQMHRIGKFTSPLCPKCRRYNETVHHCIFRCPAYKEHRAKMAKALNSGIRSTKTVLANPKALPALFRYINETRRFTDTYGIIPVPTEE
jgi:ribonuclease HI